MIKLRKSQRLLKQFVLFLTACFFFIACRHSWAVQRIDGKQIPITESVGIDTKIETFITPYRDTLSRELNTLLAYSPATLEKSQGVWQTSIGNMMADACLGAADSVLFNRERLRVDMCMLNFGGIRSIIPKGNITTRSAFELMPFENSLVVAQLDGAAMAELLDYFIKEKKAHPLAGIKFTIKGNQWEEVYINNKPLNPNANYYVATSDYLYSGGDNMLFFSKAKQVFDLNYKIRDVFIDYFKKVDTIVVKENNNIKVN